MNIGMHGFGSSAFGSGLLSRGRGLKSTEQKIERQEARDRQVAFFENQKENLKNVTCETVEEIARKLELFHSYEDQIKAAKMAYNNEQMMHMMDESREIGEKIAEAVEKSKPKTPEERLEDLVEEAAGTESGGGILDELDEVMDEVLELQEELQDVQHELQDVQPEMTPEELQKATENLPETVDTAETLQMSDTTTETAEIRQSAEELAAEGIQKPISEMTLEELRKMEALRHPFDVKI